jgi:hypothetical protein
VKRKNKTRGRDGSYMPTDAEDAMAMPVNFDNRNQFLDELNRPIPGICCVCGCEEDNACDEGCQWVNEEKSLCSSCLTLIGHIPSKFMKRFTKVAAARRNPNSLAKEIHLERLADDAHVRAVDRKAKHLGARSK